jgi:phosphoribosylanthranilate isomerase
MRSPEEALVAVRAGADAIGMVFHPPAPRNIPLDRGREIMRALPPFVTPVGIFVDAAAESVVENAWAIGLRHVQLNGHETPEQVRALAPLVVIKAIRVAREDFAQTLATWHAAIARLQITNLAGFVLETANTGQAGGTGVANDWEAVRDAQSAGVFDGLPPIIAAGGLRPENVGEVVRTIRPYAVDVSSGVEVSMGVKSAEKIATFAQAVRDADASFR